MEITVIAHPNSKKPRVEKDPAEAVHVYVREPPLDGKANRAVTEALAAYLGIKKNRLFLASGARSKIKVFETG